MNGFSSSLGCPGSRPCRIVAVSTALKRETTYFLTLLAEGKSSWTAGGCPPQFNPTCGLVRTELQAAHAHTCQPGRYTVTQDVGMQIDLFLLGFVIFPTTWKGLLETRQNREACLEDQGEVPLSRVER